MQLIERVIQLIDWSRYKKANTSPNINQKIVNDELVGDYLSECSKNMKGMWHVDGYRIIEAFREWREYLKKFKDDGVHPLDLNEFTIQNPSKQFLHLKRKWSTRQKARKYLKIEKREYLKQIANELRDNMWMTIWCHVLIEIAWWQRYLQHTENIDKDLPDFIYREYNEAPPGINY